MFPLFLETTHILITTCKASRSDMGPWSPWSRLVLIILGEACDGGLALVKDSGGEWKRGPLNGELSYISDLPTVGDKMFKGHDLKNHLDFGKKVMSKSEFDDLFRWGWMFSSIRADALAPLFQHFVKSIPSVYVPFGRSELYCKNKYHISYHCRVSIMSKSTAWQQWLDCQRNSTATGRTGLFRHQTTICPHVPHQPTYKKVVAEPTHLKNIRHFMGIFHK